MPIDSSDSKVIERRLAAILAADIAGYSALMGVNDEATVRDLKGHQSAILPMIASFSGRVIDTAGDGILAEFASVLNAIRCAVAIQQTMAERNAATGTARRMQFRIGVNLGDVVCDEARIYGDGVNVAARLEQLAEPGGICISGKVFDEIRTRIDLDYEDIGEQQLKNIAQPVRAYRVRTPGVSIATVLAGGAQPLSLPDKPSIAVLPFTNMSGAVEEDYFADGITDDIITALSRLRWLFVIARNSTFTYKGQGVDVRRVARDLGVRYVLEGSIRAAAKRIRVTGQLIDATVGKHIWAEKYDRQLDDIFAVQDEITENVVAAIEPHLYAEEGYRAESQPPETVDAWSLVVRAIGLLNKVGRRQNEEAQGLLRRAIDLEPGYSRARAILAWAVWWSTLCYWTADPTTGYGQAARHAEDALARDANEPWARMTSGLCLSTLGQHERGIAELNAALALNPSFALGHTTLGWALLRAGRYDEALTATAKALRMSPMDSFAGFYTAIHGLALVGARRFEEAMPYLRQSVAAFPEYAGHINTLISCCGHLGLVDEAQAFIAHRNRIGPSIRVSVLRHNLRRFAHCDTFIEGLVKAGVPE